MSTIHINHIEAAINFWSNRAPGADAISISKPVSLLADCYGEMIYRRMNEVSMSSLSPEQIEVFKEAAVALAIPC